MSYHVSCVTMSHLIASCPTMIIMSHQVFEKSDPASSCHIMCHHVSSRRIRSFHVSLSLCMSRHVSSCLIMSRHVSSCFIMSHHVSSYLISMYLMSSDSWYLFSTYLIISYAVLSYPIPFIASNHIILFSLSSSAIIFRNHPASSTQWKTTTPLHSLHPPRWALKWLYISATSIV